MNKFNSKHVVEEIQGSRCTVVDNGITKNRLDFLKNILEINGFSVIVEQLPKKSANETDLYKIGVTDITFNPTIAVYERRLKTNDGIVITPSYWLQESDTIKPYYWL